MLVLSMKSLGGLVLKLTFVSEELCHLSGKTLVAWLILHFNIRQRRTVSCNIRNQELSHIKGEALEGTQFNICL